MKANYVGGNYGYGHAKQALFELICETLNRKEKIQLLHKQPSEVDALLKVGAEKWL
jgi:tryptophanyl-tRNA synthetase